MITSADIGLADWHTYPHRDGSATMLRQTVTRLALISHRGPGEVFVRLYHDPHGMDLARADTTDNIVLGLWRADSWLGAQ